MHSGRHVDAGTEAGAERLAAVIRLRPIRTTVISPDTAYRDRAWTVLSELGSVSFAVTSPADPDDIAGLLLTEPADVVLLDATGCESAAHAVIEALAQVAPRTGVVVVCHHCTEAARALHALPKWGWTQDLRAGVERAYHAGNPPGRGPIRPMRRRSPADRAPGPLLG